MDQKTGVIRLVLGSAPLVALPIPINEVAPQALESSETLPPEATLLEAAGPVEQLEEPEVIHVRRGTLPEKVFQSLFGDK